MATCRDCLHDEACRSMLRAMGYTVDGDGIDADKRCEIFKDKTKYAEVVRCKDCKHWHEGTGWCDQHSHYEEDELNEFDREYSCAYGERKVE